MSRLSLLVPSRAITVPRSDRVVLNATNELSPGDLMDVWWQKCQAAGQGTMISEVIVGYQFRYAKLTSQIKFYSIKEI